MTLDRNMRAIKSDHNAQAQDKFIMRISANALPNEMQLQN